MFVSQNNNRLILAIVVGIFLTAGCSGHSVKYGANSEGEGMSAQDEEMKGTVDGATVGSIDFAEGRNEHGGAVDGSIPSRRIGQDGVSDSPNNESLNSDMTVLNDTSSSPGSGSDYGQQFDGVDGSGPNHGGVTGFGSGSAEGVQTDPEAWANAYLQEKNNNSEFYGDPSSEYNGNPSASDSTTQSAEETNPEAWAQDFVKENGGPAPEHVNSDMNIVEAKKDNASIAMGGNESNGDLFPISNIRGNIEASVQDIYFSFDSWSISAEGAKYLEEDAEWLHANPGKALTIEGHCDQRGTQDYNLVLGKKRAEAARDYLVNLGVQPHRLKIVSYGKERPFCQSNNNEDCHQENRRNHMVVRMNQS